MSKEYVGDGVYVDVEGLDLVLTTENGIRTTNRIVLEPEVLVELFRYIARHRGALAMRVEAEPPLVDES